MCNYQPVQSESELVNSGYLLSTSWNLANGKLVIDLRFVNTQGRIEFPITRRYSFSSLKQQPLQHQHHLIFHSRLAFNFNGLDATFHTRNCGCDTIEFEADRT